MKRINAIFVISMFFVLVFFSCNKKKSSTSTLSNPKQFKNNISENIYTSNDGKLKIYNVSYKDSTILKMKFNEEGKLIERYGENIYYMMKKHYKKNIPETGVKNFIRCRAGDTCKIDFYFVNPPNWVSYIKYSTLKKRNNKEKKHFKRTDDYTISPGTDLDSSVSSYVEVFKEKGIYYRRLRLGIIDSVRDTALYNTKDLKIEVIE